MFTFRPRHLNQNQERMFLHLKRSGKLEKLNGLIIGNMSKITDDKVPFENSVEEIIGFVAKARSVS